MKLTRHMQALYGENCNTFLKDVKKNLAELRTKSCSWIRRFTIVKILIIHNIV